MIRGRLHAGLYVYQMRNADSGISSMLREDNYAFCREKKSH